MISMPNATATKSNKPIPANATFLWRKGIWYLQADNETKIRRVPRVLARALESLRAGGVLQEKAPGLFRLDGPLQQPVIDETESPLARLMHLKQSNGSAYLDAEQFRAGEQLRKDFERAQLSARVTMNYRSGTASGAQQARFSDNHIAALSDTALAARGQVHRALKDVGAELSGILYHVCCLASGLEQAELRLQLPRRSGKAVLLLGLTRLARHYGYKSRLRHGGPDRIGHWAVDDFRPVIAPQQGHQL
jgi:hypothetical protein